MCSAEPYEGCECEVIAADGAAEAGFTGESTFSSDDASETALASSIYEQLFSSSVIPEMPALGDLITDNGTTTLESPTSPASPTVSETSLGPTGTSGSSSLSSTPTSTSEKSETLTTTSSSIPEITTTSEPPPPPPPPPPTTTTEVEDPGPTGDPASCTFFSSLFKEKSCFFFICGGTSSSWLTALTLPDRETTLWEEWDTNPGDRNPWEFGENSIGIQEPMALQWDGEEASCRCNVDGNDIEGSVNAYEDGDGGFTYWSREYVCVCEFECHPSG